MSDAIPTRSSSLDAPAVVVPNWNGRAWLSGCLDSLDTQTLAPARIVVVDNGSSDGSQELLRERHPRVQLLELGRNTGFAFAANRGVEAVTEEAVALINTDVVLAPDWLQRMARTLAEHPDAASVACKMVDLADPSRLYDAGDFLRRDGVCEQRGRFLVDQGDLNQPGEVFAACAGAALYRRSAFLAVGGFEERYFAYLEDVELGLRLRLAGWSCRYQPAVAHHAGGASSSRLSRSPPAWVERNTLLLVARWFPVRWLPYVAYRQLGWAWHALRRGGLRAHLDGLRSGLRAVPAMLRERRASDPARVPIERAVPRRPLTARTASRALARGGPGAARPAKPGYGAGGGPPAGAARR